MEEYKWAIKNNKFKVSAPTLNGKFELSYRSYYVSAIQVCFKCIIKEHETVTGNTPTRINVN